MTVEVEAEARIFGVLTFEEKVLFGTISVDSEVSRFSITVSLTPDGFSFKSFVEMFFESLVDFSFFVDLDFLSSCVLFLSENH